MFVGEQKDPSIFWRHTHTHSRMMGKLLFHVISIEVGIL